MELARRLCEHGCGFVTVTPHFVWDMHADSNNAGLRRRPEDGPGDRAIQPPAAEPQSTPVRIQNLLATILQTLVDIGEVRLIPGMPREIAQTMTRWAPIPGWA